MPRARIAPKFKGTPLAFALQELDHDLRSEKLRIAPARKMYLGCCDCGYRRHATALQFDHRPGEVKLGNISQWRGDIRSMIEEMDKCDVVCANCHAVRTALRYIDETVISAREYRPASKPAQVSQQELITRIIQAEPDLTEAERRQRYIAARIWLRDQGLNRLSLGARAEADPTHAAL